MDLRTIINKTISGVKYIMTQPTMMFRNKQNVEIIATHIVKEDDLGRPDLIALEHYNDDSKTDVILKWNGISDPFSLQVGDVLEIPNDQVPFYKLERPMRFEDNIVKNEFIQSKRLTKKDQARLEALKKKYNKETLLPPNVIPLGKKNYRFDGDGTVVLGAQAQNDAVVDSIVSDLSNKQNNISSGVGSGVGGGSGVGASGGISSGAGKGLTETQLDNALGSGNGGGSGAGAGSGSGVGGGTADSTGGAAGDGSAPQSTGNGNNIANDGAPCN